MGEAADTLDGLLESSGLSRDELAARVGMTRDELDRILSASEDLSLRSLAAVGWALGIRFRLRPVAVERSGTPSEGDPPVPSWLSEVDVRWPEEGS